MTGYPGVRPVQAAESHEPRRRDLEPPKLISGKLPQHFTAEDGKNWFLWNLGPRFRKGLRPPPEAQYYIPPIPGSECDVQNSHSGSVAGYEF